MSLVEISDLTKQYSTSRSGRSVGRESARSEFAGVEALSLAVDKGEFFTLLGPSGCGKTTTLRCIAGLLAPDSGEVSVGGRLLYSSKLGVSVPVARRGLGMVFQSYAIWPHLSVYKNVSFPLEVTRRASGMKRSHIRQRVEQVLEVVGLGGMAGRGATELSGGQQQRLALARALVGEPPLLLLDEPLSNLDAKLRDEMRVELRRLCRKFETTMIYVTHDQTEALSMSTRIGVMDAGRVVQLGRPTDVYRRPASKFVGEFIGAANVVDCKVLRRATDSQALVETDHGELLVRDEVGHEPGSRACVVLRSEDLKLVPAGDEGAGRGTWPAKVVARSFMGESIEYLVEVGGSLIRVRRRAEDDHPVGAEGRLVVDEAALVLVAG